MRYQIPQFILLMESFFDLKILLKRRLNAIIYYKKQVSEQPSIDNL